MGKGKDTPMMKHFFSVKAQYPEAILLYRVGDFYETYSDDALLVSKVLGILLTKRSSSDDSALPMAGFPHHSIDTYLPRLVRAGYKVAICDQVEDPKLAGNKLVKRDVTELVTPGVAFSDQILEQKEHNYIASISHCKDIYGLAILDVSTGSFQITQGSVNYINTLLSSFKVKEVVVCKDDKKLILQNFGGDFYISTIEQWAFVLDSARIVLQKQLNVDSLKGYAIDNYPLGISSAGALLVYLEQTRHGDLKNICAISRIDEGDFVWLDKFTFRNLEVFNSSNPDGVSLVSVIDKCSSPMGARLLRTWITLPLLNIAKIADRHDIVEAFYNNYDLAHDIACDISNIGDLERILSRLATSKISPKELLQLSRGLSLIPIIAKKCESLSNKSLSRILKGVNNLDKIVSKISNCIDSNCPNALGKGDVIKAGVDAELDRLRSIHKGGKDYLQKLQEQESQRTGISSLKIGYNNIFGYYLEVRNIHKDRVPQDWVRKQTLVSAERYITSELKEYEDTILGAEEKIYAIEARIYNELIADVQSFISQIQANAQIIAQLDVLIGFGILAVENNYVRPIVDESNVLDIVGGRHPVIETLLPAGEEYISNNVSLDPHNQQIIVLTGPNMSGKSAVLRQTALIVLLAQIGSFVPAQKAHIGYFDKIFTRVGASDNISRGESTFMVEMLETSMILHNLSSRSLVLLDEIGRGTSTYDGMSIAKAIIEYIYKYGKGAKTLFATHYHELNDLEKSLKGVVNYHVSIKEVGSQVIFLRKLVKGGSAHSFGIHVAKMAGMPQEVLQMAQDCLDKLEASKEGVNLASSNSENTPMQLSLFQLDDPTLSSLRNTLKNVDLNNLTPLQAFDLIRNMKKELGL